MTPTISLILLIIGCTPLLILLFAKPRLTTWLLIGLCIFDLGFAYRWFGTPRLLARLPLIIAHILGARIIADYLLFPKTRLNGLRLLLNTNYLLIALFFLLVVSNLYNGENFLLGAYELRYYLFLAVLVYSIYLYIPVPSSFGSFIYPVIIVGLIQLPFTLFQNLAVNIGGIRLSYSELDMVSGTFIGYEPLIFCQGAAIGLLLTYQLQKNSPLLRNINNYFLAIALIVPLLLSYSRAAVAFILFTIFIVYLLDSIQKKNFMVFAKNISLMVVFPTFLCVLFYFFFWKKHDFLYQLNVDFIVEYLFRDPVTHYTLGVDVYPVMGRGRAVIESIKLISQDPITFLIGCGSGAVSDADFLGISGRYYQKYGSLAGVGRTQFGKNMCEFGLAGAILLVSYYFSIIKFSNTVESYIHRRHMNSVIVVLVSLMIPLYFYSKVTTFNIVNLLLAYSISYIQICTDYDDSPS